MEALRSILDPQCRPLLVCCNLGRHHTGMRACVPARTAHAAPGTVIGCLRKVQGWCLTSIFEEYRRYAGRRV